MGFLPWKFVIGTDWTKKFFLKDYFDAVIVCTGTYAEPYYPDIPGTPYYPDIPGTKTINSTFSSYYKQFFNALKKIS